MQLNFIICGVGGQGNLLASTGIAGYAMRRGLNVVGTETIGAAQRGGSVISHIRISDKEIYSPLVPVGAADVLLALEPLEALRNIKLLSSEGRFLINDEPIPTVSVNMGMDTYPSIEDIVEKIKEICPRGNVIPASSKARELGSLTLANTIMLGALSWTSEFIDDKELIGVLCEILPDKVREANMVAFREGMQMLR